MMKIARWKGWLVGGGATALLSCDDGPTQTPQQEGLNLDPAAGLISLFPPQKLGASTAGQNALRICTPEKLRSTWEKVLAEPIVPIRGAGGIDATRDLTYTGVSIDEIEQKLCQGFSPGVGATYFGEQGELGFTWSPSTRLVNGVYIFSGYRGALGFNHPTTKENFTVSLESKPIEINGQPMRWTWRDRVSRSAMATRFYNAIMLALAPDKLPKDENGLPKESTDCTIDGGCIATVLANTIGALGFPQLGFLQIYFDLGIDDPGGKDIVTRVYVPIQKSFAFGTLPFILKMPGTADREGAVSKGNINGKDCVIKPGVPYQQFVDTCVRVTGSPEADEAEVKKFLSGLTHSLELYAIDAVGVQPLFHSKRVLNSPEAITIQDSDRPDPEDPLQRLWVDQQVTAPILNDYAGESTSGGRDNHGSGLVNLAYAILVQKALDKAGKTERKRHPIGDPACVLEPDGSPAIPEAEGCTGMEGFITTAPPGLVAEGPWRNVALGAASIPVTTATGLRPANNQITSFTDDPSAGMKGIKSDLGVVTWAGSVNRVIKVLGKNNRLNIPPMFREPRGYSTIWMEALTMYLIARGNVGPNVTLQDVLDEAPDGASPDRIDENYFEFETSGNQQFDSAEYIETSFATKDEPFYDMHITVDSRGGILNNIAFETSPNKGEKLVLGAAGNPDKPIGGEHLLLFSNLYGSYVLSTGWTDPPPNPESPWKTAYDCASADLDENDGAAIAKFVQFCGAANLPPLDANGHIARTASGRPLLEEYPHAFASTGTIFHFGKNVGALPTDLWTVLDREPSIEQSKVVIKTPNGPLTGAIGYMLPTDETGFFVPVNASRDRFVKTENYYTTGIAITSTLQMVPVLQDLKVVPGLLRFSSVDDEDFLGHVFLCKDRGELLGVKMFTPSEVVLDWVKRHPNAVANCGLVFDWWEYGQVLKGVDSLVNGMTVDFTRPSGISPGAENSVVGHIEIYSPGQ
jgi:hypothetical protein